MEFPYTCSVTSSSYSTFRSNPGGKSFGDIERGAKWALRNLLRVSKRRMKMLPFKAETVVAKKRNNGDQREEKKVVTP